MTNKIIVITGTPGAGKSTVLAHAMDKIKRDVEIINYADVMLELGNAFGLGANHDALRKQPIEVQQDLQKKAAEKIATGEGILIVDTHATVRTPAGYMPGMPAWCIEALKPHVIVLVDATSKEIQDRRAGDKTRKRDREEKSGLELQQCLNLSAAMSGAVLCGATVKVIWNHDNGLEKAAKELADLVEGI